VQAGLVIEQTPTAGSVVDQDSRVDLVLSRGPGNRIVPDVAGQTQQEATSRLQALQLTVATTTVDDLSQPVGSVNGTSPASGTSVPTGSTVTLQVVSGFTTVPNVVDQPVAEATRTVTNNGLTPTTTGGGGDGAVVQGQTPSAGARIARGSTVTLTVAAPGPAPTPTPSPSRSASPSPSAKPTPSPSSKSPTPKR
jgi:serine/threonine-protein kinase